jgi:hypothetical protein
MKTKTAGAVLPSLKTHKRDGINKEKNEILE